MLKKKVLIGLTLFTVLAVPFSVFAANSSAPAAKNIRGFLGMDASKLTDKQKANIKDYSQKMADIKKEFINKMVTDGAITKEQGDAEIKKIDEMLKNGTENGFVPGFGGKGDFRGHGKHGGFGNIDTSKLTDTVKADLKTSFKKMTELQKERINKMVSLNLLTKEQGDAAIKKIDEMVANVEKETPQNGFRLFMGDFGGFSCFGPGKVDTSKLTAQQKAELDAISTKMTAVRKEMINKLVTAGVITKEQGDAMITKAETLKDFNGSKGFSKGKGMKRGHFGNGGFGNSGLKNNVKVSPNPAPTV